MRRALCMSAVVLAALAAALTPARAEPFVHTFGGDGGDRAIAVTSDAQGGIYVLAYDSLPDAGDATDQSDLVVWQYVRSGATWDADEIWRWDGGDEAEPIGFVVAESAGHAVAFVAAADVDGYWVLRFTEEEEAPAFEVEFVDEGIVDIVLQTIEGVDYPRAAVVGYDKDGDAGYHVVSYDIALEDVWDVLVNPDQCEPEPVAAACNDRGDVFVTGTRSVGGEDDFLTVRLRATDGGELWRNVYGAGNDKDEAAVDIAVVPPRDYFVVVTGTYDDGSDIDVATVVYQEGNGTETDHARFGDGDETETPVELGVSGPLAPAAWIACYRETDTKAYVTTLRYGISSGDLLKPTQNNTEVSSIASGTKGVAVDWRGNSYAVGGDWKSTSGYDILTLGFTPTGRGTAPELYAPGQAYVNDVAIYYSTVAPADSVIAVVGSKGDSALTLIYNAERPAGWDEVAAMPDAPSGKQVKAGGWLVFNEGDGLIYAAKGNKRDDFYSYNPASDTWERAQAWPLGTEGKPPKIGATACCNGTGHVYATKGNNTQGFWMYDVATDSWHQKANVPLGTTNKKVKGGTDLVYVPVMGADSTGHVYLLKGYKNEFYRYSVTEDSWYVRASAPPGGNYKYEKGSFLAYDGAVSIYAHKAKYNELWKYDIEADTWCSQPLAGMPFVNGRGKSKKSKDGGSGVLWNGSIFALKGNSTQEFWKYSVDENTWLELDTLPQVGSSGKKKRVKDGGDLTRTDAVFFALKGNKCNECWAYYPVFESLGEDWGGWAHHVVGTPPGQATDDGETPVMEGIDAFCPKWRPDGQAIIMVHEDSLGWLQLYEVEYSNGIGTETRITNVHADCEQPSYSPEGNAVCFSLLDTASGFYQVATVTLDSNDGRDDADEDERVSESGLHSVPVTALQRPVLQCPALPARDIGSIDVLTSTDCDHTSPVWSPGSGHICYVKDSADERSQLWLIPATGGTDQQITTDDADHEDPVWLTETEIAFTHSADNSYDQIAKVSVSTNEETDLTSSQRDHAHPDANEAGTYASFEALDDDGDAQVARVCADGGDETFLTTGDRDMEAPDWSGGNSQSIFCVRWTGVTSAICRVDATNGGFTAVTDSSAIRDNPDAFYDQNGSTSYCVFEREEWDPESFLGFRPKWRHGTGIFRARYRRPHDGVMSAGLGVLALHKAVPNPFSSRLAIHWSVPKLQDASLRVYNTAGQQVRTLAQGLQKPGAYTTVWNGTDNKGRRLAAGVYFYTLETGDKRLSRKVVLTQ